MSNILEEEREQQMCMQCVGGGGEFVFAVEEYNRWWELIVNAKRGVFGQLYSRDMQYPIHTTFNGVRMSSRVPSIS